MGVSLSLIQFDLVSANVIQFPVPLKRLRSPVSQCNKAENEKWHDSTLVTLKYRYLQYYNICRLWFVSSLVKAYSNQRCVGIETYFAYATKRLLCESVEQLYSIKQISKDLSFEVEFGVVVMLFIIIICHENMAVEAKNSTFLESDFDKFVH